jgi:hypothetical protein
LHDKGGLYVGHASTTSEIEGEIIPWPGAYRITTAAKQSEVAMIDITFAMATGESYRQMSGAEATFTVFKHYLKPELNFFIRNVNMKILNYDFAIAERIWGW